MCSVDKTGCEAIITQRALVFLSAVASRFRFCGGSAENFVVMLLNDAFHVIHTAVANIVGLQCGVMHYASLTARSLSTLVTPQCNPTMCNRNIYIYISYIYIYMIYIYISFEILLKIKVFKRYYLTYLYCDFMIKC